MDEEGPMRKVKSTELWRNVTERMVNVRRRQAYEIRKAAPENQNKVVIAEAQRCRFLRPQAD